MPALPITNDQIVITASRAPESEAQTPASPRANSGGIVSTPSCVNPAGGQVEPVVLAEPVAQPVQGPAQGQLRLGVGAPDRPHVGRTARGGGRRVGRRPRLAFAAYRQTSGTAMQLPLLH